MKEICLVIPTLRNKDVLKKCLAALLRALDFIEEDKRSIVVIDNGNSLTNDFFPNKNITLIKNPKNLGFACAVNQGIKKFKANYYLILNDDCFVEKETIKTMLAFLQKERQIFATQPVILRTNGEVENIGFYVDLKIGKAYPITDKSLWDKQGDNKRYLLGLSATCLLVRGEVFERVGFFDESFHSYLEDVDLAIRCFKNNLPLFPNFKTSAIHLHMTTSSKMGSYKAGRDFINWVRIIKKNYSKEMIIKYSPFLLVERLKNLFGLVKSCCCG